MQVEKEALAIKHFCNIFWEIKTDHKWLVSILGGQTNWWITTKNTETLNEDDEIYIRVFDKIISLLQIGSNCHINEIIFSKYTHRVELLLILFV